MTDLLESQQVETYPPSIAKSDRRSCTFSLAVRPTRLGQMNDADFPDHQDARNRIDRWVGGEQAALDDLLPRLLHEGRTVIDRELRGRADPGDTFSEFEEVLLHALPKYDPERAILPYVSGIARNVMLRAGARNKEKRNREWSESDGQVDGHDGSFVLENAPAPSPRPAPDLTMRITLELFFLVGGFPHQQIAFGFSTLVFGKAKQTDSHSNQRVGVWADPARVAEELSDGPLETLFEELILTLQEQSGYEGRFLDRVRRPVDMRMQMTVAELFAREKNSAQEFRHFADATVRHTLLRHYYGKNGGAASVADWNGKIKKRMRAAVFDPEGIKRSPLPCIDSGAMPEKP